MQNTPVSILFMDDEPTSTIVEVALQRMKDQGYRVDFVDTMSQAIEAYYQHPYDVFVLDIDMSHRAEDLEGDGVQVLKRFVSLHNQTQVILFSGAGTVPHWFAAANAHCFAYIAKDEHDPAENKDSVDLLLEKIQQAILSYSAKRSPLLSRELSQQNIPQRVLLLEKGGGFEKDAQIVIEQQLPEWDLTTGHWDQVDGLLPQIDSYGAVIILALFFDMRTRTKTVLSQLSEKSPCPPVLVGCLGKDEYRPSILYLANLHPFRMMDLNHPQWPQHLKESLIAAQTWYGKREIFPADLSALQRIHITLPEKAERHWTAVTEEEMEEAYQDYFNSFQVEE